MKVNELVDQKLIVEVNEKYRCLKCNNIYTKIGIANHYYYAHTDEGRLKKETLRQKAIANNNTPEMKKKISKGTLKAFKSEKVKNNHLNAINSEAHKDKMSKIRTELWKDPEYHKRQSAAIRKSNTTEKFKNNMSKTIKSIHNTSNSKVKSQENREKHKVIALEQWKDPIFREKQIKSRLKSWTPDRRIARSKQFKKMWKNPEHIEKVLRGKINYLIKTGQNPSLGKFGITKQGTIYESRFEQEVYEYLEENNYSFEAHVNLPNSSKISDIIIDGVWIELDGLNRSQFNENSEFSWNGKIEIYEYLKETKVIKDFKVFTSIIKFKEWCNNKFNIIID